MRSISQEIHAANSKIAQFLRSKEDEEALLAPKRRKAREEPDEKPRRRISKWLQEPDYSIPSSLVDRPRTSTGGTSFHFKYDPISKVAFPIDDEGRPITWCFPSSCMSPLEHARYIERDDAVATITTGHASYIERDGVVERIPSVGSDHANTLPTDPDQQVLAIVTNISDDIDDREHYWREVPDQESSPRRHHLHLNHSADETWWAALASDQTIDRTFKTFALEQHVACTEPEWKPEPFSCDLRQAGAILSAMPKLAGFDARNPPATLEPLRAGRIQYRMVLELPSEASPAGRLAIMTGFCSAIGSLEDRVTESGATERVGMMHTGAIHAPDSHNDSRNFHLHVVAHDRPAELVFDEQGKRWVFATKKLDACRKIGFVEWLRCTAAGIVNDVLKAEGIKRHYDPRRYSEMGINRTPTKHLGGAAHTLETVGIPTVVGSQNAVSIWRDAEAELLVEVDRIRASQGYGTEVLKALYHRAWTYDPDRPDLDDLWRSIMSRDAFSDALIEERKAFLLCELNEAKAKSRPVRTMQTCRTFLNEIDAGQASRNVMRSAALIRARFLSAKQRLEAIDEALMGHRAVLAEAKDRLIRHVEILRQFDEDVKRFARAIEHAAQRGNAPIPLPPELASRLSGIWKYEREIALQKANEIQRGPALAPVEPEPATPPKIEGKSISEQGRLLSHQAGTTQAVTSPRDAQESKFAAEARRSIDDPKTSHVKGLEDVQRAANSTDDQKVEEQVRASSPAPVTGQKDEPELGTNRRDRVPDEGRQDHGIRVAEIGGNPSPAPVTSTVRRSGETDLGLPPDRAQFEVQETVADETERGTDTTDKLSENAPPPKRDGTPIGSAEEPATLGTEAPALVSGESAPGAGEQSKSQAPKTADPVAIAPVGTNTTGASVDLNSWNQIFDKMDKQQLRITQSEKGHFSVDGLAEDDAKLLHQPQLATRTQGRLRSRFDVQQKEVLRLLKWLERHGRNPSVLQLQNRTAKLLSPPPPAIGKFWEKYHADPAVIGFLRAEHARRERAKAIGQQGAKAATPKLPAGLGAQPSANNQAGPQASTAAPGSAPNPAQSADIPWEVLQAAASARGRSR